MKYFSPGLLDASVTTAKLADNAVTTAKLIDDAVTTPKLIDAAVVTAKIQDGTIEHADIANGALGALKMNTLVVNLSGSIPGNSEVDLTFAEDVFWPMVHVSAPAVMWISGHSVDQSGANNPRFSIVNSTAGAETYDVDVRHLEGGAG